MPCAERKRSLERVNHVEKLLGQSFANGTDNRQWHMSVEGMGDASCDGRLRIAVSAERYRQTDRMLNAGGIQEGDDRFWHRSLTRDVPLVSRPDLVDAAVKVVAKTPHQFASDLFF